MNDYYRQKQFLAQVDEQDNIIGQVEKWEAHKRGVLHRGYTAILQFQENIVLQHRKHPVFDDVYDFSFSSHQLFIDGKVQSDEEAIYEGLKREWGINKFQISHLKFLNKIYYKAKDQKSEYTEHEIDYIYVITLNTSPQANLEYAYGQKIVTAKDLGSSIKHLSSPFAPWVEKILEYVSENNGLTR